MNVEKKNAYMLLVGTPEGNRHLGGPRHRWVDSTKMNFGEIRWIGIDWIGLAYDRDKWGLL
jgi:hypothetical protein